MDQYSVLTLKDLEEEDAPTVNDALILRGDIGGLVGLSTVWRTWVSALKVKGLTPQNAPVISGLDGPRYLLYVWTGRWRTVTRPEFAAQVLTVGPHSPVEFRCNQISKNTDEFHATLDVREGDGVLLEEGERVHVRRVLG